MSVENPLITPMKQQLENEDPRHPFTDEWLARRLGVRREQIVEARHRADIPDSRIRLKAVLQKDIEAAICQQPMLSDRALTIHLQEMGYDVSRYLVGEIRRTLLCEEEPKNNSGAKIRMGMDEAQPLTAASDAFSGMIGANGGLQAQIHQAKAAVSYPPNGLNTLIIGPSGTGKTFLAESMYHYAVEQKVLPRSAPFICFNCADYADNPQLLNSQLFGYVKGAFSGANDSKEGLVAKADGGILFLDEVHRLSGEGQEMLFYLLDKGSYRRLGDSGPAHKVQVRLIAATTSAPESALLLTFRRRIPMVISMPALSARPLSEKFDIVKHIFETEQKKLNRKLIVQPDAVNILLQYECMGNIGQLQSDIQVCCAHAFLENAAQNKSAIYVTGDHVRHLAGIGLKPRMPEGKTVYDRQLEFPPESGEEMDSGCTDPIYNKICQSMQEAGAFDSETLRCLERYLADDPSVDSDFLEKGSVSSKSFEQIQKAVALVLDQMSDQVAPVGKKFEKALSVHLKEVLSRNAGKDDSVPWMPLAIKEKYPEDFAAASLFFEKICTQLNCALPEQEHQRFTLYFHAFSAVKKRRRIRIIIMTHGQTGVAMAEVVNHMLCDNNTTGFSMDWEESNEQVLERAIQVVQQIDEGLGCLLLVDMGSLASFAPEITLRTGVSVQCVARVDTLMALDAAQRILLERSSSLEQLARTLEIGRLHAGFSNTTIRTGKPPAVLTVCITGDGNARRVRSFLNATLADHQKIEIIEVGLLNRDALCVRVEEIRQHYDIVAAVGTMNPEIESVPFLSMDYVFSGHGTLALNKLLEEHFHHNTGLGDLLDPQMIFCNADFSDKNDVIDKMYEALMIKGCVGSEFLLSVYKRENMGITCLPEGIAIPHGETCFVKKPAICVAQLRKPVVWAEDSVAEIVFLFALNENSKDYIQKFYEVIKEKTNINLLKTAKSVEEIYNLLA